MAEKQVQSDATEANAAVIKAQDFWAKFSKPVTYAGSAVILLVGAWFGYKYFITIPKQQKANETIFAAEKYFGTMVQAGSYTKDSVQTVLNGGVDAAGNKITGLLSIIKNYSGTPAANLANYMTGACYLQLNEFDKAISHLKDFDGNGASQIQSAAYRMLGDAYAGQKKNEDAFSYYKKAVETAAAKDESTKFLALSRAALFCDATGKTKEAIGFLKQIKDEINPVFFIQNRIDFDTDKYLAKLGVFE
jgi:tetratricopeptide (TPR) repeat protein